jgi:hypothetical protein
MVVRGLARPLRSFTTPRNPHPHPSTGPVPGSFAGGPSSDLPILMPDALTWPLWTLPQARLGMRRLLPFLA